MGLLWDAIWIATLAAVWGVPWMVLAWRAERPMANKSFKTVHSAETLSDE